MSHRAALPTILLAAVATLVLPAAARATYPGQNGQIAYAVQKYDKKAEDFGFVGPGALYLSGADGSGTAALPDDRAYYDSEPAWSPDGLRLAHASVAGGKYDGIYTGAAGTTKSTLVAKAKRPDYPTWAPNGTTIAYVDGTSIFTVDTASGGAPQLLLRGTKQVPATAPSYSADGKAIFYARETIAKGDYTSELWAADPTGDNPRKVVGGTGALAVVSEPDVSPDSAKLVFVSYAAGTSSAVGGLWVSGVDGSAPRKLARAPRRGFFTTPSWSPDGTKIVAAITDENVQRGSSLVLIDPTSGTVTSVRKAKKAWLLSPSWQPLPTPAAAR